jgi:HEPN domain-containing protein
MAASLARDAAHDGVCFHCQQCAEKYLKSLLEDKVAAVPRTHDLVDLLQLLVTHYANMPPLARACVFLTQFAVEFRYPGKNATLRQATAALRWTARIRDACRSILGLT